MGRRFSAARTLVLGFFHSVFFSLQRDERNETHASRRLFRGSASVARKPQTAWAARPAAEKTRLTELCREGKQGWRPPTKAVDPHVHASSKGAAAASATDAFRANAGASPAAPQNRQTKRLEKR